ncbi:outer membrane protein assembly factor [Altibacter sp. HG106]|uniref:outer membrane protein assembly factor n=1 Tax=Altibacter sp. HG106 TaxID=3023937 RepID=UPI002350D360|nr:outer membrane protein assembly factor [Altibacter sp. HG106]MDC7994232.1 outer membrane protein assembly factor [Altibacter sp. HG106]
MTYRKSREEDGIPNLRTSLVVVMCFISALSYAQNIAEIRFENLKKTKPSFVQRLVEVAPGKPLDSTLLERDMVQLIRLPGIAHAAYETQRNEDGTYLVIYRFEENFTLLPTANIWTTDNDEFAYKIGLYEFNGLGRNISFGGFYQNDIFSSWGVNFRAPFLFAAHWGLAANYQDLTTQEPVFLDARTANYRYNNTSYELLGLYRFNLQHRLEAGASFFTETYEYLEGATRPDVPTNLEVDKFLLKGIYEYNTVKRFYYLVDGFKSTVNLQYVNSSDKALPDFFLGFADLTYYRQFGVTGNWASRLRLGIATNSDTPFAPFAVDNNLNIRGVGNTIDRGTAAIVLNTEYRHTLFEKNWFVLQGNAFVDAGSWRNPGGDLSDFGDNQNLRIYPGLGLRFIHKRIFNTVFRVDYGMGITKDATQGFVIGIGQYF